jgi:hypothetical protein
MMRLPIYLVLLFALFIYDVAGFNVFNVQLERKSTSTHLRMTILSYNGKKKDFKAGSPLSVAVKSLGVPVKYSCKK